MESHKKTCIDHCMSRQDLLQDLDCLARMIFTLDLRNQNHLRRNCDPRYGWHIIVIYIYDFFYKKNLVNWDLFVIKDFLLTFFACPFSSPLMIYEINGYIIVWGYELWLFDKKFKTKTTYQGIFLPFPWNNGAN